MINKNNKGIKDILFFFSINYLMYKLINIVIEYK